MMFPSFILKKPISDMLQSKFQKNIQYILPMLHICSSGCSSITSPP
uniref:Uncharacterized protein n=1 Tax=Arundo donax TaxID=35708 RepID=A0A0A9FMS6_ARUDO